jgi:hypothetical protein
MEQSPWESDISSTGQEISRFSWHPKVHYGIHKTLKLDPIYLKIPSKFEALCNIS